MNEPVVATPGCYLSQEFSGISFVFQLRLICLRCYFSCARALKIRMSRHVRSCWNAFGRQGFGDFTFINSRLEMLHIIGSQRPFYHLKGPGVYNKQVSVCFCDLFFSFWLWYPFSLLSERATVSHLHPCGAAQMWLSLIPALWTSSFQTQTGLAPVGVHADLF